MISCLDATMLILLFDAEAKAPPDPTTKKPVTDVQDRLNFLVNKHVRERGSRIIVPTPALGEFLVRCKPESMAAYMGMLQQVRALKVTPFAQKAALEFADMQRAAFMAPGRRIRATEIETRARAKFDQQIVAIARAEGATTIYSDDKGLAAYAKRVGIETIGLAALPLSPDTEQGRLPLEPPAAVPSSEERGAAAD